MVNILPEVPTGTTIQVAPIRAADTHETQHLDVQRHARRWRVKSLVTQDHVGSPCEDIAQLDATAGRFDLLPVGSAVGTPQLNLSPAPELPAAR